MILRDSQKKYSSIFKDKVLRQKTPKPVHAELPCNFGKTELIVNHNISETRKEYPNKRILYLNTTIMTSAYETFVKRVGDWADQKDVWYNEDESDLESLINNPKKYLKQYDDICIFTTLNKIFNPYSEQKFQDLLRIAIEEYGFVWCWNRDEGDYAGFDSEEHQSFEAGTGKTKGAGINDGASHYAKQILKLFEKYKQSCLYLLAMSGTPLNAHKNEVHLERNIFNPVSNIMGNGTISKDKYGIVSDDLNNHLLEENKWTKIIDEHSYEEMKELNIQYNSFFLEPKLYHKDDYKNLIKNEISYNQEKQNILDNLKTWLIDNLDIHYPNVSVDQLSKLLDDTKKIGMVQTGKSGDWYSKSFITPQEYITTVKSLQNEFDINPIYVHSDSKIDDTIQGITEEQIVKDKINLIGVCDMMSRGFDIPYISSLGILYTSPKMDKKSIAAPYTKRMLQTIGRAARFDGGVEKTKGQDDIKEMFLDIGININLINSYNIKLREYIKKNLEVQTFLSYDTNSDTATYVVEKMKRMYVMEKDFNRVFDDILGEKVIDLDEDCPCCNGTGKKSGQNPIIDISDFKGIDKSLGL